MTPFVLVFIGPVLLTIAIALGGAWVFVPPAVLFGIVPAIDQLLPPNHTNTPGAPALRWLPMLFVPVHLGVQAWALWAISTGAWTPVETIALAVAMGFSGALAINVAHELMHRPGGAEQTLAAALMTSVSYTHFCVEHVQGHHKHVATARDPASSRAGESLYAYLPRTLVGSLRSAWAIEAARSGPGPRNRLVRYAAVYALLVAGILTWLGPLGLALFLVQSVVAILFLETVNYVEHYGLVRAEIAPGRPERVKPYHSWNSSHRVSNWLLLNLARHSDHHAFAARPFMELRHHDDAPQLPGSYSAMLMLATLPPLWFRVMDPRLEAATRRAAAPARTATSHAPPGAAAT